MTQGRVPEEEELKLQQRPDRGDDWGHVGIHLDRYAHMPPGAFTYKPLIDEVLSKVNQDQWDDVTLQALEEQEDITYVVGRETGTAHRWGQAPDTIHTLNTVHFS